MLIGQKKIGCLPIGTGILGFALLIMVILFVLQTLFIQKLVVMVVDLAEVEVLIQTKSLEGVDPEEVKMTFAGLRKAIPRGKINFRKARATASYAQKARADDEWTADEVNVLLTMINETIGVKKGEK
jgi:hypothetical protein